MQMNWYHRLYRLLLKGASIFRTQGASATMRWFWVNLRWQLKRIDPEFNRRFLEHLNFDRDYGVDTYGTVLLDDLNLSEQQKRTGCRYEPYLPWLVRDYISKINVNYQEYEFIDLGSGKGRVLLLAASYPFKRVLGVEFSEELNKVAKNNIAVAQIPNRCCSSLEALCEDASKFIFPDSKLILSLFNPFGVVVLKSVLKNLLVSLEKNPREVYLVYINPINKQIIEDSGRFEMIEETEGYLIYRYLKEES